MNKLLNSLQTAFKWFLAQDYTLCRNHRYYQTSGDVRCWNCPVILPLKNPEAKAYFQSKNTMYNHLATWLKGDSAQLLSFEEAVVRQIHQQKCDKGKHKPIPVSSWPDKSSYNLEDFKNIAVNIKCKHCGLELNKFTLTELLSRNPSAMYQVLTK